MVLDYQRINTPYLEIGTPINRLGNAAYPIFNDPIDINDEIVRNLPNRLMLDDLPRG